MFLWNDIAILSASASRERSFGTERFDVVSARIQCETSNAVPASEAKKSAKYVNIREIVGDVSQYYHIICLAGRART